MARPKRNSKGQFVKKGRKPARRKASRSNPPAKRRRRAPAKRAPAKRRRAAPRNPRTGGAIRRRSRKNPQSAMTEIIVAGVVVGGVDVLAGMFLAPVYPKITMWAVPIVKGLGGYYLRTKTKMKDAGTVLIGSAVAELTTVAITWATGQITPDLPAPGSETAAWFRMNGNFPRGQLSHPMSSPNKLGAYLADRRITDPLPTSGVPNLATAM